MGPAASVAPEPPLSAARWEGPQPFAQFPPLPRLARLRQALLDAPYYLCSQKAELLTEFFRAHTPQHWLTRALVPLHYRLMRRALDRNLGRGVPQSARQVRLVNRLQLLYLRLEERCATEPRIVTMARALAYVLERQRLRIYDNELIVGNLTAQRIAAAIHPDFGGILLLPELRALSTRKTNPLRTTPEQVRRLEQEIFPYWFSASVLARAPLLAADPDLQNTLMRGRNFILTQFAGISHVTPDYPAVLEKGFEGLLAEAEAGRRDARDLRPFAFSDAAAIVARAAIAFGARWRAHCTRQAEAEPDAARAAELRHLAAILARVPARPAESFHEALQSVFLTHVMVHQESFQHGVSFGRVDQYLYPYYARDVEAGRLTSAQAVELIGCFLGKAAEQLPLFNAMATEYFSGLSSASGLTLGGTDAAGRDATNDLSYLFLIAYDRLRLRQPNLHLRVHPQSPASLLALAYEVLKKGGGMPALFNDAAIVPALERLDISVADARDYAIVGCVEWGVPRKSFPAAGAGFLSLPAVLDDVLHTPPHTHGLDAINSMDALVTAFRQRLGIVVAAAVAGNDAIERAHARFRPTPLLSLIVHDCLSMGCDVTDGGARYNSSGLQAVGLADVADSFAAIEQLVFVERRVTLAALVEATDADFAGQELLRQRILNKVSKYGEDAGRAERWAAVVARLYCELVRAHRNPRGGAYAPGFWSMTTHVGFGRRLGALPSGRRAGQPLADGVSPANGCDRCGPTASLMSVAGSCGTHVANGLALNERLDPCCVAGPVGTALMDGLTQGYFAAGGQQVQYNILDVSVLLDAKRHPERHRDLVVRISGYSAYFNDLTEAMQDDIIARTPHGRDSGPACRASAGAGR
jgi:pyruvate formate-lyase/glycerol dehydratase family glycyl radical enzyme